MPIFHYEAISDRGKSIRGVAAATSKEGLIQTLASEGLLVNSIKYKRQFALWGRRHARVSVEELLLFTQELSTLLKAGLTVPEALNLAAPKSEKNILGQVASEVLDRVRQGDALSSACADYPEVFDALYISALMTGERTGELSQMLRRYQDYLKAKIVHRRKITQALVYPAFLLGMLGLVLVILFIFVMPRFVEMYTGMGAELPKATQLLMDFSTHIKVIIPIIVVLFFITVLIYKVYFKTEAMQQKLDQFLERLPWLGNFLSLSYMMQLSRTLSVLLSSGSPLAEAMSVSAASMKNLNFKQRVANAMLLVIDGVSMTKACKDNNLLTSSGIKMIEVGEASGNLPFMLYEISQYYEELLDNRVSKILSLLEPMLMLLMGIIVGSVIVIMYLPIFSMAEIIQ